MSVGTRRRVAVAIALVVVVGTAATACKDDGESRAVVDKERFCAKVAEFNEGTQAFDLTLADGPEVDRIARLLDEIAESAPEEIRDDVARRFAYVDDVIAASRGDEAAAGRLGEVEPTDEEQQRIDAYAQRACGIALDTGGSTTPGTSIPGATIPTAPADAAPTTVALA